MSSQAPAKAPTGDLATYTKEDFTHDGVTHPIYRKGTGPAVIVVTEMPGMSPQVIGFADRAVALGCTAVMPQLFGTAGRDPFEGGRVATTTYALRSMAGACISREFTVLATGKSSPVVTWLRALAKAEHERCGGPGVGVVGMCFTGGFALAMAVDDNVLAPVLSQPSLPFPLGGARKRDLGISDDDLAAVKRRCADDDLCVLGLRFTNDVAVPPQRFERLRQELGDCFVSVEIDSSKGNRWGIPKNAHSVLTEHLVDEPGHP